MVEYQIVILGVAGSSPVSHPKPPPCVRGFRARKKPQNGRKIAAENWEELELSSRCRGGTFLNLKTVAQPRVDTAQHRSEKPTPPPLF